MYLRKAQELLGLDNEGPATLTLPVTPLSHTRGPTVAHGGGGLFLPPTPARNRTPPAPTREESEHAACAGAPAAVS